MKLRFLIAVIPFAAAALMGCSDDDVKATNQDPGGPVKNEPLKGTIDGKAFQGKIAMVTKRGDDSRLTIYDQEGTCAAPPDTELRVLITVKGWAPSLSYNFDFTRNATLFVKSKGLNAISVAGRLEVSADGKSVGIRANTDRSGGVEGTVPVLNCTTT
ncbi:hypothetical protein [Pendulispora albinea]|uniref:Lipoprotein n=1 Tax=Pendulispora albinea TaxID=2741071 RepID=A0ABZ2LL47_9BACT